MFHAEIRGKHNKLDPVASYFWQCHPNNGVLRETVTLLDAMHVTMNWQMNAGSVAGKTQAM